MRPRIVLTLLFLAACSSADGSGDAGQDAAGDLPAAGDLGAPEAVKPDLGPDTGPTASAHSGEVQLGHWTIDGQPALGRSASARIRFYDDPPVVPPAFDSRDPTTGEGCVIYLHNVKLGTQDAPPKVRDEGDVTFKGTLAPIPTCKHDPRFGAYFCKLAQGSSKTTDALTYGKGLATLDVAGAGFKAALVGQVLWLKADLYGYTIDDLGVVVSVASASNLVFSTKKDFGLVTGTKIEYLVHAAGVMYHPKVPALIDDQSTITVQKGPGKTSAAATVTLKPAGSTFKLDQASLQQARALSPASTAAALTLSCTGTGGDCGGAADHTWIALEMTQIANEPLYPHLLLTNGGVALGYCNFFNKKTVTLPAGFIKAALSVYPWRAYLSVFRGRTKLVTNSDGTNPVRFSSGYGVLFISKKTAP